MAETPKAGDFFTVSEGSLVGEENLTCLELEHRFLVTKVH
jgi:hypothetical protein